MVQFVSWERAQELVRQEPVVFVEIMTGAAGRPSLEVHVMYPTREGLQEAERDDTGPVRDEKVRELVTRIAAARNVRYAAIRGAEDHWPPAWA
jgi:hypothetical protein